MVYLVISVVILSALVLLFLLLRFVQPELIYIVRHALIQVRSTKAFLDSFAYRFTNRKTFPNLLGEDLRYETHVYDEKYVLKRVDKIRELYRVLVRKTMIPGISKKHKPQVCIVELAGLLGNLGRHVQPDRNFNYSTIDASLLLTFIGNEIRKQLKQPPLMNAHEVEAWFTENPISIEQVVEILITGVFGLAYRQRVQEQRKEESIRQREEESSSTDSPSNVNSGNTLVDSRWPARGLAVTGQAVALSVPTESPLPIKIFVSYSHQDEKYLRPDSLVGALKGLENDGVEFWFDQAITTGNKWDQEIRDRISESHIALVLVSQAYLDSPYCQNVEISRFLEETEARGLIIMPIMLSRCEWDRHGWLRSGQFLPRNNKTIEEDFTARGKRKRLFHEIRQDLRKHIDTVRAMLPREDHTDN